VLAGHGTVQIEGRLEDLGNRLVGLLLLPWNPLVDHDVHVDVAVPGMAEVDDGDIVLLLDLLDHPDDIGHLRAGNDDVLVELVRVHVPKARRHQPPHLPERLRLGGIPGNLALHQTQGGNQLLDAGRLLLDQLPVAVHLDEEHGPAAGRDPHAEALLHALQGGIVHELQGRRDDLVADDGGDRLGSSVDGVEHRQHGLLRLGQGEQLEDDLGDHPQSPLGAAEEPGQVVADHPLVGLAAGTDDLAGRQNHLQPHDEVPGNSILDAAGTAGILRHVAAKGGKLEGCRVRGVEETEFLHRQLELLGDHPRLHLGDQVLRVDAQDPVEAGHHQNDAAPLGERAACKTAPRAAGEDRDLLPVGKLQHRGNLPG